VVVQRSRLVGWRSSAASRSPSCAGAARQDFAAEVRTLAPLTDDETRLLLADRGLDLRIAREIHRRSGNP